ncbi:MAG: acetyl-CoA carboxylase biotin carboxyl carrier protein [Chromatiales bacterium]
MDIRKIKKLIDLLQESGIAEIEIKEGEESVRISRHSISPAAPIAVHTVAHAPSVLTTPTTGSAVVTEVAAEPVIEGHVIKAPMVGTYYASASPSSAPFVSLGSPVKKGDVLCIIEAMKIMNQIEADQDGIIASIHTENGQPVEFDQPLFTIT